MRPVRFARRKENMPVRSYTIEDLKKALEEHDKWLNGLGGTRANLTGANLTRANLTDADLTGADLTGANLTRANLTGAKGITAPVIPHIDAAILQAIDAGGKLNMGDWHSCETTHCRAGWAIHLAGLPGKMLEDRVGPGAAGSLIYAASRPGKPIPNFYDRTEDAMADILAGAKEDPIPSEVQP